MAKMVYDGSLRFVRAMFAVADLAPMFALCAVIAAAAGSGAVWAAGFAAAAVFPLGMLALRNHFAVKDRQTAIRRCGGAVNYDDLTPQMALLFAWPTLFPVFAYAVLAMSVEWDAAASVMAMAAAAVLASVAVSAKRRIAPTLFPRVVVGGFFFALFGYRVWLMHPPDDGNPYSGQQHWTLIARRRELPDGDIRVLKMAGGVYFEVSGRLGRRVVRARRVMKASGAAVFYGALAVVVLTVLGADAAGGLGGGWMSVALIVAAAVMAVACWAFWRSAWRVWESSLDSGDESRPGR